MAVLVTKTFARKALRILATPGLFLRLIHGTSDLCYSPLSLIAWTEVDANDAVGPAGGWRSCSAWAVRWSAGLKPSPIAHENLKSRAPRRLRLILLHIEAYAPRGSVHFPREAPYAVGRTILLQDRSDRAQGS
jgi:hypothetical protein